MPRSRLRLADLSSQLMPIGHICTTDIAISSTAVDVHTLALPEAGTYLVELADTVEVGTLTAGRTFTWTVSTTNFASMSMSPMVYRNNAGHFNDATKTTNGHTIGYTVTSSARVFADSAGIITVSAAAVLTVSLRISDETGTLRAGSYLRARRHA